MSNGEKFSYLLAGVESQDVDSLHQLFLAYQKSADGYVPFKDRPQMHSPKNNRAPACLSINFKMKFEMQKILLTLLFIIACSPSAFAFSYNNCNITVNYGSGITSRSIAVYGLAHYEILAALNIHSRAISLGGVNRNSQKFNLWVNARSGQQNMSHYQLTRSAVSYAQKLKSLPNRYPTAAILKAQKAKLFLADYYHGIYPLSAKTVRKNMHDGGIATYLATRQCKYDQDSKYRPTFQTLFADIGRIAAITGRNSRAKTLISGYQTRLLQLDRKLQGD